MSLTVQARRWRLGPLKMLSVQRAEDLQFDINMSRIFELCTVKVLTSQHQTISYTNTNTILQLWSTGLLKYLPRSIGVTLIQLFELQ